MQCVSEITNKPVGDRDHEVLGMGSFGEYKLNYTGIKYLQEYITSCTLGTSYITRAKH
jgi:hypothetical protein